MSKNYQEPINKMLDEIKGLAKTETVIGDPFQLGEFTCVPVIKIGFGMASGMGGTDEEKKGGAGGGGGAGGIGISPIAFLVSKGDEISVLSLEKKKGLSGMFDKVPDLLEKVMDLKKEKKEEKK